METSNSINSVEQPTNGNQPPQITSSNTFSIEENIAFPGFVQATDDFDEPSKLVYSISGGADADLFNIDGGLLSFNNIPDFEDPADDGKDNVYQVQVSVEDTEGLATTQDLTISVTDVDESNNQPPLFANSDTISVEENQNLNDMMNLFVEDDFDLNSQLEYSISGGADANLFNIDEFGFLRFNTAPDFENPADDGKDNVYQVQVSVEDTKGLTATQDLTISVTDVDDGGNGGNNDFVDLSNITFTNRSDVVEKNNLILIPDGSFVSTLAGDDLISSDYTTDTPTISLPAPEGSREVVFGIYNQESLDTSSGRDTIIGDVEYTGESLIPAVYGITQAFNGKNNGFTSANISTGSGDDKVSGLATSSKSTDITGISNLFSSEIDTGAGRDEVRGEASGTAINNLAGISQTTDPDLSATNNLIVTGNGSDKVIGVGDGTSKSNIEGIAQDIGNNQLITGNGNDEVIGEASGSSRFLGGITQGSGENQIITDNGNDKVIGEADGNASLSLLGILQTRGNNQIITDNGNDKVIGKASGNLEVISGELGGVAPGMVGISQREKQEISTGNGSDEVIGEASGTATSDNPSSDPAPIVGIAKSNSTIETGNGNDKVMGEGSGTADIIAGIAQQGSEDLIITENGNDEVIGKASGIADAPDFSALMAGIAQQPRTAGSQIITGKGNDKVEGTAENDGRGFTAGILGDLDILTGEGNDEVIASAKLFGKRVDGFAADPLSGGTVTVDTGSGNDLVKGFGQGHFDGGKGNRDVYDLSEYHKSEFAIEIGAGGNNEVNFTHTDDFGESTAFTQGFEVFRFADDELSFSDLP